MRNISNTHDVVPMLGDKIALLDGGRIVTIIAVKGINQWQTAIVTPGVLTMDESHKDSIRRIYTSVGDLNALTFASVMLSDYCLVARDIEAQAEPTKHGYDCVHCGEYYEYAQSNLPGDRFICFGCRQTNAWQYEPKTPETEPRPQYEIGRKASLFGVR